MKMIKKILIVSLLSAGTLHANEAIKTEELNSTKPSIDVNKTTPSKVRETAFFPLKHYNAAVIRTKIRPFLGKEAQIASFKFNNMVVISAYPESIKSAREVIDKIESIKSFDATVVKFNKALVKDVHADIDAMSKALFHQTIYPEQVNVIDSNATNSLILVGKKENRSKLLNSIKLLDIEGGFTSKNLD